MAMTMAVAPTSSTVPRVRSFETKREPPSLAVSPP